MIYPDRGEQTGDRLTPGTLGVSALFKLMDFPGRLLDPSMIHWGYLMDDNIVAAFTPHLPAARVEYLMRARFDPTMIDDALGFIKDGMRLVGGGSISKEFKPEETEEIQRAILQVIANKHRLDMGKKLPEIGLSVVDSPKGKLVKIGNGLAPIPDPNSQTAISALIEGQPVPALTSAQTGNVVKNLEVVNTLAGTTLSL